MDIEEVRAYLAKEHGLATVSTRQADGRVLSSVANCGVINHPITGAPCVALVSVGGAARLGHVRRGSQVTIATPKPCGSYCAKCSKQQAAPMTTSTNSTGSWLTKAEWQSSLLQSESWATTDDRRSDLCTLSWVPSRLRTHTYLVAWYQVGRISSSGNAANCGYGVSRSLRAPTGVQGHGLPLLVE